VANIKAALNANDFAKAQQLCDKQKGSVANVLNASLNAYREMEQTKGLKLSQKIAKIQQAHEEATQLEMPTLTMNLPMIATIVTLGTLTGLLGTVVGMIRSFSALSAGGGADSAALSAGISEALINTAFGIGTSWCAVVSYNYYTNKVDKLTYALDEVGYSIAQNFEANHTEEL
jgi:biopolymer transport protein ExbB